VQSGDWRTLVKKWPKACPTEAARGGACSICGPAPPNLTCRCSAHLLPDDPGQYASAFGLLHGLGVDARNKVQEWVDQTGPSGLMAGPKADTVVTMDPMRIVLELGRPTIASFRRFCSATSAIAGSMFYLPLESTGSDIQDDHRPRSGLVGATGKVGASCHSTMS
jgi:hypothetical protein